MQTWLVLLVSAFCLVCIWKYLTRFGPVEMGQRYYRNEEGRVYGISFFGLPRHLPTLETFFGNSIPPINTEPATYTRIGFRWRFLPTLFQERIYLFQVDHLDGHVDLGELSMKLLRAEKRRKYAVKIATFGVNVEWRHWQQFFLKGGY